MLRVHLAQANEADKPALQNPRKRRKASATILTLDSDQQSSPLGCIAASLYP